MCFFIPENLEGGVEGRRGVWGGTAAAHMRLVESAQQGESVGRKQSQHTARHALHASRRHHTHARLRQQLGLLLLQAHRQSTKAAAKTEELLERLKLARCC